MGFDLCEHICELADWDSFQAIEPYLNASTPEIVDQTFAEVTLE